MPPSTIRQTIKGGISAIKSHLVKRKLAKGKNKLIFSQDVEDTACLIDKRRICINCKGCQYCMEGI